jgi:putative transcriptional regulator
MTKQAKKPRLFDDIKEGLLEAIAVAKGEADPSTYKIHVPKDVNVKAIRKRLGLSQTEFAARFGFTCARVRDWEQNRYHPDGALRAYLIVIDRKPEAVKEALAIPAKQPKRTRRRERIGARASV